MSFIYIATHVHTVSPSYWKTWITNLVGGGSIIFLNPWRGVKHYFWLFKGIRNFFACFEIVRNMKTIFLLLGPLLLSNFMHMYFRLGKVQKTPLGGSRFLAVLTYTLPSFLIIVWCPPPISDDYTLYVTLWGLYNGPVSNHSDTKLTEIYFKIEYYQSKSEILTITALF